MALPTEVACGASSFPSRPVSTRTAWRDFAHRNRDHRIALQRREMHGFAGGLVDLFQIGLRAARQIDLQAGVAEIEDAGAQRIEPAARHLGGKAALDQRRQQMMAGRNIETGAVGEVSERRLATGFGDGFQQKQRAVDRLDVVAIAGSARPRRTGLGPRRVQNDGVHGFVLPGH